MVGVWMGLDEDAGDADRDRRPREHGDEFPLSARRRSLSAGLLHRMGRVENDRRAGLARKIGSARMSETRVL